MAEHLKTEIISADSRQIYRDIPVCSAAPTEEERKRVRHHLVGCLDLHDYYSAARFESDSLSILDNIWKNSDYAVVCGGSLMYVDALTKGLDELPDIPQQLRDDVWNLFEREGIEGLRSELERIDPEYYGIVDLNNHKRMIHAIEIFRQSGNKYSSLRKGLRKERPFAIKQFAIAREREDLFGRINSRVDSMVKNGLIQEAEKVYHLRELNSLNTVGMKEMFAYFDGKLDLDTAIARIGKNTRVYAKKQLTWMKKNPEIIYLDPSTDMKSELLKQI